MSKNREQQPSAQESYEAYGEYKYDYQPAQSQAEAVQRAKSRYRRNRNGGFFKFLIFLCILSVGLIVVQETVFRLETVYVVGNEEKTPQQVVTVSGLVRGRNMLSIEESEVAAAMEQDHTLIFKGIEKEYPGTIYLYIEERKTVAAMQWLGMLYTLDAQGLVMAEKNSATLPQGLPVVNGFGAGAISVGHMLNVRDPRQLEAYQTIMYEMSQQLCFDQFSEVNLSDPDNLYLVTVEGVTVRAGDASHMEQKIGAVRTAMGYLRQLGKVGGILDVTKPADTKYMPENGQ